EDAGGASQRERQPQHRMKEVPREHHRERRSDEDGGERPEGDRLRHHASLPAGFAACASSARAILGGPCIIRSRFPIAHDCSCCRPIACKRSLSSSISRRSAVARSNDFIITMASVEHTCTHSSQNSQAYSSSEKLLA